MGNAGNEKQAVQKRAALEAENARLKEELARRVVFTKPQLQEMRNGLLKLDSMSYEMEPAEYAPLLRIQRGALVTLNTLLGLLPDDEAAADPRSPPPSAEKLALRGEPTARTLVEALAGKNSRLLELVERWGIIHSQGSEDDGANEGRKYQRCRCCGVIAWDGKAMQHKVKCEVGATLAEKQTIQAAARAYLSTRAQQEEEERDGWQRDRLQVLMLQEQAVKDRDAARLENTRLVGWNQKAAHRLRLSLSELRSFVDRATRDGVATTAAYRSLCDIDGEATLLATGAAPPSDKQAIRQPGVAARAPAEEALIEAARAYKLEDIRTGHVVAEIGQRASLYAIGTASEALCAAARAIPISPTAVHDVLMASAASADKTDPDLATGLRTRAALALPVEGLAPAPDIRRNEGGHAICRCSSEIVLWLNESQVDQRVRTGEPPGQRWHVIRDGIRHSWDACGPDASHEKQLTEKGAKP